jgi:hypothetical protein
MKWSTLIDAMWPPIQVAHPHSEGMTFPQAVFCASKGARIRRKVWDDNFWLETSYSGMYLAAPDQHRYGPTIEEIGATDWEIV